MKVPKIKTKFLKPVLRPAFEVKANTTEIKKKIKRLISRKKSIDMTKFRALDFIIESCNFKKTLFDSTYDCEPCRKY